MSIPLRSRAQFMEFERNPNGYVHSNGHLIPPSSSGEDIYRGETPPPNPEPGTVWYKPSEDRYYHWFE